MTDFARVLARKEAFEELQRVFTGVMGGADHVLVLSDYEAANLRALLDAIQTHPRDDNPLGLLDTGDWTYQVRMKLPYDGEVKPNHTPDQQIENVRRFRAVRT